MSITPATPRKNQFSREDLLACGEGKLFEPNSPRLPIGQMLMIDRVTWISDTGGAHGKGELRAELDIDPSLWFFDCHFRGDPVMPGCLGLDALWQLSGFYLSWAGQHGVGRALGVGEVKFFGQVLPTVKKVTYQIDVRRVITRKLALIIANGSLSADGTPIYTAADMRVGVFENQQAMQAGLA